jgi:cupin fold WbuC family metalloprotein
MIADLNSRSLSFRLEKGLQVLSKNFLKNFAKKRGNNQPIMRICLNKSSKNNFHQMVIFQNQSYIPVIKKEIRKDKSFIIIEGEQKIRIYNKQKKIIKNIYLNKSNVICWIPKNTYYDNISLTTRSIHIESLSGPFNKDKDRVFL